MKFSLDCTHTHTYTHTHIYFGKAAALILEPVMRATRERPSTRPTGRRSACFNPDGSAEPYAVPCASEGESHCCSGASGICLSNGYCMDYQQPFAIWRGSCTDSTWGSVNCPEVCTGMYNIPHHGKYACSITGWVVRYGIAIFAVLLTFSFTEKLVITSTKMSVCPSGVQAPQAPRSIVAEIPIQHRKNSSLACVDGGPVFTLPNATPVLGVAGLRNAEGVSSTNSTSDASGATTPTVGTAVQDDDCSSQKKDTITVGSVLGVSLVAVAIALILWAIWERRQKILWWQRAIGLAPKWPPKHAAWMRSLGQRSKPPPCPITRAKLLYTAHQQHKNAQEQQPVPTCGAHQPEISSPQRLREMPGSDVTPPAAEMDAT